MNIGIIIGLLTVVIALILNYLILFKFEDDCGKKVTHFIVTYYWTWFLSLVPFIGMGSMITWFLVYVGPMEYRCTSILFKEK